MNHCPRCHVEVDEHDDALLDALGHIWHTDCADLAERARLACGVTATLYSFHVGDEIMLGRFDDIAAEALRREVYVEMVR